jgi:hypothetical protein
LKTYGGVDVEIHIFLTSALVADECSASQPGRFTPGKKLSVPIVVWVNPTADLDDIEK